jgi:Bacterial regulatory proteins, luxR family
VLELLVEGKTQAQTAEALKISPATAKTHVTRLYSKLQARNRSQALLDHRPGGPAQPEPRPTGKRGPAAAWETVAGPVRGFSRCTARRSS